MIDKKIRTKKSKRIIIIAMVVMVLVFILLSLLLLNQLGILESHLTNINLNPRLFLIDDKCSLIVGQLMHTIDDDSTCKMKCKTECGVRKMVYRSSEFIKKEADCNECKCYCI